MDRWSMEKFQGSETTLCNTIMVAIGHYSFSQPIEHTIPRVNPNVNSGLWMIVICQCWFSDRTKCTTLVWVVYNRVDCACVGTGSI